MISTFADQSQYHYHFYYVKELGFQVIFTNFTNRLFTPITKYIYSFDLHTYNI